MGHDAEMGKGAGTVIVTGAAGELGRAVQHALAAADPDVEIVTVDATTGGVDAELKRRCEGARTLIHLGRALSASSAESLDGTGVLPVEPVELRHLLDVASDVGVRCVVSLSSAMVYGAWPNNAVPLTEDAALRPDPALPFAVEHAEAERILAEWRDEHDGVSVAILRPAITVDDQSAVWLARSPWSPLGVQVHDAEPPSQFLHRDDLVAAVVLAATDALDGCFNVAPDGWMAPDQRRALRMPGPRVHVPRPVAERIAVLRWRFGTTGIPPAVLPYTIHPWVVANDRLRAAGWSPSHSSEEAYVEADRGGPLAALNPKRRQMIAIGAVVGGAAAITAAVVLIVRRRGRSSAS